MFTNCYGKTNKKCTPWHSETWLIGNPFCDSQQIENIFCLHAAIFEIPKWRFRIKSPACWGTDVSIDMYHLLLLFSIILPWLNADYKFPQNYTFLIPKLLSRDINYHDLRKKLIKSGKKEISLSDRNGYETSNFICNFLFIFYTQIHRNCKKYIISNFSHFIPIHVPKNF